MSEVHIYTAPREAATWFIDRTFDPPTLGGYAPYALLWAHCCGKRRRAANLVVQCFYDGRNFWCAPGKGCKDPKAIVASERRRFRNRSRGQKRRWLKVKRGDA